MTPIETFEKTLAITLTCFQILNQTKLVEEGGVEPNEGAINQPIVEDQANLGL
jgi:hypothetical protein